MTETVVTWVSLFFYVKSYLKVGENDIHLIP